MVWKRKLRIFLYLFAVSLPVFSPMQDAFAKITSLTANQDARIHDMPPSAQPPPGFHVKFARNLDSSQLYRQQLSKQKQRRQILLHRQKIQEKKQQTSRKKLLGKQKAFQKKHLKKLERSLHDNNVSQRLQSSRLRAFTDRELRKLRTSPAR